LDALGVWVLVAPYAIYIADMGATHSIDRLSHIQVNIANIVTYDLGTKNKLNGNKT